MLERTLEAARQPRTDPAELLGWLRGGAWAVRVPAAAVILAHPDDEAVGLGSRLPLLREATFIYVTDGSPADGRDAAAHGFATCSGYGLARRRERLAAFAVAGIDTGRIHDLGITDQEASLHLGEITRRIAAILGTQRPEVVITHPYEGGHPDHDGVALATHAACRLLREAGRWDGTVVEFACYHRGESGIRTGEFLGGDGGDGGCVTVALTAAEARLRRHLFGCYTTKRETLGLFRHDVERFRVAPAYDFTRPPHEGPLYYERFPWGMSGERFRELAAVALAGLGLMGDGA